MLGDGVRLDPILRLSHSLDPILRLGISHGIRVDAEPLEATRGREALHVIRREDSRILDGSAVRALCAHEKVPLALLLDR
jgi:hypothetical protein